MIDATLSESLVVEIGADFSSLSQGLAQAGQDVSRFAGETVGNATRELGGAFDTTFGTMERAIAKAARTGKLSISDMVSSILADLARIAIERSLQPIENIGASAADALVSSLGGLATGGPVAPNSAYVVGERGPEIFVPAGNGQIVPNAALPTARPSIVVNIQTPNAQSFFKSESQVAAMMTRALARGQRNF